MKILQFQRLPETDYQREMIIILCCDGKVYSKFQTKHGSWTNFESDDLYNIDLENADKNLSGTEANHQDQRPGQPIDNENLRT